MPSKIEKYDCFKTIERDAGSKTVAAIDSTTGRKVFLKIYNLENNSTAYWYYEKVLANEFSILTKLEWHKNIVKLIEYKKEAL